MSILRMPKLRKFASTFKTIEVEFLGCKYHLRVLSAAERMAFYAFTEKNDKSVLLVYAWIVEKACHEFEGEPIDELALHVSPDALEFLGNEALKLSKMRKEDVDELEKKS